jgi:hypothetical protein
MATGDSKLTITAETKLDSNTEKLMDLMSMSDKTIKIYTQTSQAWASLVMVEIMVARQVDLPDH